MKNNAFKRGHGTYRGFLLVLWLVLFFVVLRVGWLQLYKYLDMAGELKGQFLHGAQSKKPRGKIVDCNGDVLAVSLLGGSMYIDNVQMRKDIEATKKTLPELQKTIVDKIGPVVGLEAEEIYKCFEDSESYYVSAKRMLSPEQVHRVKEIISEENIIGVTITPESIRYYPKNTVAAQVLGFVGMDDEGHVDDKGLGGMEYYLNDILIGKQGKDYKITNVFDKDIVNQTDEEVNRKLPTVYLTLDSKIQYVLESAMDDAMEKTKAQGAAALLMNPYTGEILGMVSRPTFNPNSYEKYPPTSFINKCVSMVYEPGSVFKPIVGCMGLTEGLITPNTLINDEGYIQIGGNSFRNWDGEGRGVVPFSDVIKYSINTGMMQLGMELGSRRLIDYAKRFGFGEPTNIELAGDEAGLLKTPQDMYKADIANMAIGQGVAVTPLQMLRAICVIANGGELVQPYIVQKILDADGKVIKEGKRTVIRKVMEPEIAAQMRAMMEQVVASGGGRTASIKGYRIAGKTGTAQKVAPSGGYAPGEYIASFVGFVPADKPKYAMLVVLDTPKGMFYGSQVSAPVFRDTLQQILVAKEIQPTQSEGLPSFSGLALDAEQIREQQENLPQLELLPDKKVKLPDFKGCDMRQTAGLLRQGHLKLQPYGSGEAYKQEPAAGTVVAEDTLVKVWFK